MTVASANPAVPELIEVPEQTPLFGGEGRVYFARQFAIKIYLDWDAAARARLQLILPLGRHTRPEQLQAWPIGMVVAVDHRPVLGAVFFRLPARMQPLYRLIYSLGWAKKLFATGGTYGHLLRVGQGTANALHRLHASGVCHTDFHFKNILVDPMRGDVALVDLDGVAVSGHPAGPARWIPPFIAPEQVLGDHQPARAKDLFCLAVVIGWILLLRNPLLAGASGAGQPANLGGALDWRCLTPALRDLAYAALVTGRLAPEARPIAASWSGALADAGDALIECARCHQQVIYPFWLFPAARRSCPFCGARWPAGSLAVLAILHTDRGGCERTVRHIVLAAGADLRASAVGAGRHPPVDRAGDPVIGRLDLASGKEPRLVNVGPTPWQVSTGAGERLVPPGAAALMRPGARLRPDEGSASLLVAE